MRRGGQCFTAKPACCEAPGRRVEIGTISTDICHMITSAVKPKETCLMHAIHQFFLLLRTSMRITL